MMKYSLRNLPLYGTNYASFNKLKLVEYKDGVENEIYDMPEINSKNVAVYLHRSEIADWNDNLYGWIKNESK